MYAFVVDFVHFLQTGHIRYFLVFFLLVWLRWFVVNVPGLFYRPRTQTYNARTSVIIPVVDEEPAPFKEVLTRIQQQWPDQTIVVINGPKNPNLETVCAQFKRVSCYWTRKPGKRNAIRIGLEHASGDIVVLVDSDTLWAPNALRELIKPFADPRVGGVTARQRITNPTLTPIARVCEWLEDVRTHGTMYAMSVNGRVGCLPGRTIAFRKSILQRAMPAFLNETFLGFHKEVSDDRSLTNLTLQAGYKTVLQTSAEVYTEAPKTWRQFFRQQLRWAEGSQYNNIKMSKWMLRHARLMFFIYWTDMLLPFLLWGIYISYLLNHFLAPQGQTVDLLLDTHSGLALLLLTMAGAYLSYTFRQLPAVNERKSQLLYIPLYLIFLSLVMAPIRILGFARLADDMGWGTRSGGYSGGVKVRRWRHVTA